MFKKIKELNLKRKRQSVYKKQRAHCGTQGGYVIGTCPHCRKRLEICVETAKLCLISNCKACEGGL